MTEKNETMHKDLGEINREAYEHKKASRSGLLAGDSLERKAWQAAAEAVAGPLQQRILELENETKRLQAEITLRDQQITSWQSSSTQWCERHDEAMAKVAAAEAVVAQCPYRLAVDEALVSAHIGVSTGNAKADLQKLICWENQVALDPAVSEDAAKLLESSTSELEKRVSGLESEKEALFHTLYQAWCYLGFAKDDNDRAIHAKRILENCLIARGPAEVSDRVKQIVLDRRQKAPEVNP